MESVGFKEWALVCEALGRGEQSIILRKGGIAEGGDGFAFRHREFFLFPTFFHEQVEKVRVAHSIPEPHAGKIAIDFFAQLEFTGVVAAWETAAALESFHVLQSEVVQERFEYDTTRGICAGLVRVFRLEPRWLFPDAPQYGGCRSWVPLPAPPVEVQFKPVLRDEEHHRRMEHLRSIIGSASLPITPALPPGRAVLRQSSAPGDRD